MKLKHLIFASTLASSLGMMASTPVLAKVTGFHDSAAQINTILSSAIVSRALDNQAIVSLDAMGFREDMARVWRISTETCDIRVALLPISPKQRGITSGITYTVEEPIQACD